jgi:cardiolipin synthase
VLRQIPNLITALRILLIAPTALALLHHELLIALGLFFIAAASDLLDGFIAKRFAWQSALGGVLDPAADKLLLATSFVVLAVMHLVPLWLMATAVARSPIGCGSGLSRRGRATSASSTPSVRRCSFSALSRASSSRSRTLGPS